MPKGSDKTKNALPVQEGMILKPLCCLRKDKTMRHIDFSPLYRSTVGFDRLFSMLDQVNTPDTGNSYPPYNIELTGENSYRITMAVAGFAKEEIEIEAKPHLLTLKGEKKVEENTENNEFLYRGIATRSFERRFQLADHVEVTGANLENGLLHIDLKREIPEALKPRIIEIENTDNTKTIESKKTK
jgi:molecular chaperone IbpA